MGLRRIIFLSKTIASIQQKNNNVSNLRTSVRLDGSTGDDRIRSRVCNCHADWTQAFHLFYPKRFKIKF